MATLSSFFVERSYFVERRGASGNVGGSRHIEPLRKTGKLERLCSLIDLDNIPQHGDKIEHSLGATMGS